MDKDYNYSVLMSVYYKEDPEYLRESVRSMLNQSLTPDEIIVIKDGVLTKELDYEISSFERNYPNVFKIFALKENVGLAKALDFGLLQCKNELVARMDSDDISLPCRCEIQIEYFNKDKALCIVGTNIDEFYDQPSNIVSSRIVPDTHEGIKKFIKRRSPFNHPTVMFKKSSVIKAGGYGVLRRKQDLDLFSRMINGGCKGANVNQSLLLFRSNLNNFYRRKSWDNCKSYIKVEYEIWKRKHCSFIDLIVVTGGQLIMYVSPMWLLKWISNTFLRKIN